MRLHPEVAFRSCQSCREWEYQKDGTIKNQRDVDESGSEVSLPIARLGKVPCQTDIGCPKGHFDDPQEIDDLFHQAYQHYRECKAVGDFPQDSIVRECAALFMGVEEDCARVEQIQQSQMLIAGGQVQAMQGGAGG